MKRLLTFGLSLGLVAALAVPAVAGAPRAADMDNAKDALADTYPAYDNDVTSAVPRANGVVVTPAGGGKSPLCKITVTGLLPDADYKVWVDADGGTPGPWVGRGTFETNKGGNGQYVCMEPIGDGARVYVNDMNAGTPNYTVLVSDEVNDL